MSFFLALQIRAFSSLRGPSSLCGSSRGPLCWVGSTVALRLPLVDDGRIGFLAMVLLGRSRLTGVLLGPMELLLRIVGSIVDPAPP
eukprot:3190819-Heterocapsa_arctica.AAC.1